jgi:hypothetical protein
MARRKHRPAPNQSGLFGDDDGRVQSRPDAGTGKSGSPGDVGDLRSSAGPSGPLCGPPVGGSPGRVSPRSDLPDGPGRGVGPAVDPSDAEAGESLEVTRGRSGDLGGMDPDRLQADFLPSSKPLAPGAGGLGRSSSIIRLNGYGNISLDRLRELRKSGFEIDYWCYDSGFGYEIPVDMALCYFDPRICVLGDSDQLDWM